MKTRNFPARSLIASAMVLVAALAVAGAKKEASPSLYQGKDAKEAAAALLQRAEQQAEDGSWELIAVARVYYLSGDQQKAQALFDRAVSKDAGSGDWRRIAAVYIEAKDYDKATATLERALAESPKESKILAELGAAYNLKGDRAKAEEMFARAFAINPEEFWNTANAAGSYVGVRPK